MMSCLALPASAAEANSYQINFNGSDQYLIPGQVGTVIVNVGADRPAGNYTWTATATTGTVAPASGQGNAENFTLTVTAPTTTGDMALSVSLSNGTVNNTAKYTIHVVDPVVITAQVKNTGNVTLQNVPVQFLVDGAVVNETTFTIGANSNMTLTYNWTSSGLSNGQHTVQIVLDPNQQVKFIDGTTTFSSNFYVGDAGWGLANIVLTIVFVLLLLILFFTYMGRGRKKKRT
jgi:CARDB